MESPIFASSVSGMEPRCRARVHKFKNRRLRNIELLWLSCVSLACGYTLTFAIFDDGFVFHALTLVAEPDSSLPRSQQNKVRALNGTSTKKVTLTAGSRLYVLHVWHINK